MNTPRRQRLLAGATLLAASLLLGAGCQGTTQLVVVVDSDLEPGVEIEAIDVAVTSDGHLPVMHRFELSEHPVPFSFGVTPARANDERVQLAVTARLLPRGSNVTYTAVTRFLPGETLRLEAPLARACGDSLGEVPLACEERGQTCLYGECADIEIDPTALPVGPGSDPPSRLFEGARVAPDGGPPADSGVCVPDEPCEVGDCAEGAMRCDGDPVCFATPLEEGTPCGDGGRCNGSGRCEP